MSGSAPEPFDDMSLRVLPGSGVVHRGPGSILVVPQMRTEQEDVVSVLVGHCRGTVDPTGRRLFRRIVGVLADTDPDLVPAMCVLIESLGDVVVLAQGDVLIEADAGGRSHHLRGASSLAWVEQRLEAPVERVTVTAEGARAETSAAGLAFDLRSGTVPGAGAVITGGAPSPDALQVDVTSARATPPSSEAAGAPAAEPDALEPERIAATVGADQAPGSSPVDEHRPTSDGAGESDTADMAPPPGLLAGLGADTSSNGLPSREFESVLLTEPGAEEAREPLPVTPEPEMDEAGSEVGAPPVASLVEGALCSRGHFNDPSSAYCSVCGISMLQRTRDTVLRPRPALGVLLVDDGSAYTITSPYVLGRAPESDESVVSGEARGLVLDDEAHSVSRVHAMLSLDGWTVLLTDCGSSNGTYVSDDGEDGPWTALVPNEATALGPRTHVRLGRRQLVFDSYHAKAGPP